MKKAIVIILVLCLLLGLILPVLASADEVTDPTTVPTEAPTQPPRDPDQCGEEIRWKYESGILTVSGVGAMDDFPDGPPWAEYKDSLTEVVFVGAVTYIGEGAFKDFDSLKEVDFGDYIPQIFNSYKNLTKRTAINSKAYLWAEQFREVYPYKLTTVYEDSAFVCYMFRQNPARLLDLAIVD